MTKPNNSANSTPKKTEVVRGRKEKVSLESKLESIEQNLINSERRALGLFELTNDALFFIDIEGNYIDLNQRAAEMLGYNRQDMIGKSMLNFVADDEYNESKQILSDLVAGKILPIYVRRFKRRDGSTFPTEINAAIVQDELGQVAYIQSAIRDISERIEAEEAQQRERQAFKHISEATIFSTNLADLCQRILSGITELLGFDRASIRVYDKVTRILTPVARVDFASSDSDVEIIPRSIDDPNFIFALSARNKRALVSTRFEDRSILAPFDETMKKRGIFAVLTWPILDSEEELIGVIQMVSHSPKDIPEEDMEFFETIAKMFTVSFERQLAEEALRESEEKYRSFAHNFQGIAFRTTIDFKPIFFNGAVEEITSYTEEELIKWKPRWQEIIHTDDRQHFIDTEKNLLSIPDNIIKMEYRIIRKDGQIRWLHEISQNICDENNNPIYIQGAVYDITERKRNEQIQEIQRELGLSLSSISNLIDALKLVLESINNLDVIECGSVYEVDKSTGFLSVVSSIGYSNEFAEKLSYYSTDSPFTKAVLTGNPFYSDFNEVGEHFATFGSNDMNLQALAILPVYSDGRIISIIALGSKTSDTIPINTRKALEMFVAQIEGSIKRIGAEEALRQSDQKYRNFVTNFQGIAYQYSIDLDILFLEGSVKEVTGYNSAELISDKINRKDLIHPYDFDTINIKMINSSKDKKKTGKHEYRIITKDGEIKWVQDIWQVLTNESGKLTGYQGSIHNITDRKIAQNELQNLYQDLEMRVEERTEQLTEANKELTAFSYSVSHDLRTPLRHISGFANLLQKHVSTFEEADERVESYTQKIIGSVEEMNKLIDGLLTFSRMSRVEMVKIRINLTELVQDVMNDFQVELDNRKIDVNFNFLPDVIGDPSLLRLVLVNLLANSLKFTKTRDVAVIDIGTQPSKDADKVTIYLRDNGVGFDMKYYDKLFGVFQRLHKNEEFEGTGIGLATVQRVIRRMGGKIWAEGEIDKGATFYFSISKAEETSD